MDPRRLRRRLIAFALLLLAAPAAAGPLRLLVQQAPLAGFQYHAAPRLWDLLREGERLALRREPDNRHDRRAIAVYRGEDRLGYLPRAENDVVARALDEGRSLDARIFRLRQSADPWQRIELQVFLIGPDQ